MTEKQIRRGLRIIKNHEMIEVIMNCRSKDTQLFKDDLLKELIKLQGRRRHRHNSDNKS